MRYRFKIEDERKEPWHEEFDVPPHFTPERFIEQTLVNFNSTLRPGERERSMVSFELVGVNEKHDWEKQNLVTETHEGSFFDRYKCTRCNITGKRHGIAGTLIVDFKFKAKVYQQCDTSIAHQKKREERKLRKERGVL